MSRTKWALVVFVMLVGMIWLASDRSGSQSSHAARGPDIAALPEGAPLVEVTLPDELSPEAELGKRVFEATCASCHGPNAAGRNGAGPPFVHRIYEPSHHADVAFLMAVRSGVRAHHWPFGNMPAADRLMTDAEISSVVRYVRELQRANGIG